MAGEKALTLGHVAVLKGLFAAMVPTSTSELVNDSGFVTSGGAAPSGLSLGYDTVDGTAYISLMEGGGTASGLSLGYDDDGATSYISVVEEG